MDGLMDMFVYTFVELGWIFMDMMFVAKIATEIWDVEEGTRCQWV